MQSLLYAALLLGWLSILSLPATAQEEPLFQSYTQQGQRYEKQGDLGKALELYRKAQPYASPADRKGLGQTIDRLNDLIQQQALINQDRSDAIQSKITSLASAQKKKQFQDDLASLQQRSTATPADYQSLLRRVEAAKDVETELAATTGVSNPATPHRPATPAPTHRPTAARPHLAEPPPKSVTVSMPGNAPGDVLKIRPETKTKSAGSLLKSMSKPN